MKPSVLIICGGGPAPGINTVIATIAKAFIKDDYRVLGIHHADGYDPKYLHLVDISGTGVSDILYLGGTGFNAYINLSGNGWSNGKEISPFTSMDNSGRLSVADILGTGTAWGKGAVRLPTTEAKFTPDAAAFTKRAGSIGG